MRLGNIEEINRKIEEKITEIIHDTNISLQEKRKTIFEYLCKNITYDNNLLDKIKFNSMRTSIYRYSRNPYIEFETVMNNQIGVCNGISQYYKLLLEKIGIFSFCINSIIFNNGEPIGHQLNLVYNEEEQTFSFDDITMGVLSKDKMMSYFDFDIIEANNKIEKYGTAPITDKQKWLILSEDYLNIIYGRTKNTLKQEVLKNIDETKILIINNEDFEKYGIIIKKQNKNKVM